MSSTENVVYIPRVLKVKVLDTEKNVTPVTAILNTNYTNCITSFDYHSIIIGAVCLSVCLFCRITEKLLVCSS